MVDGGIQNQTTGNECKKTKWCGSNMLFLPLEMAATIAQHASDSHTYWTSKHYFLNISSISFNLFKLMSGSVVILICFMI
jgi:hypothetical protein